MREERRKEKAEVGKEKSRVILFSDLHGHSVKWIQLTKGNTEK